MFDFFFLTQKTAYEMRLSDWSSVVFSSDLEAGDPFGPWRELADRFQERGIGFGSRACGDREAGGKRGRDRAQQVGVAEKQPGLRIVRDIADLGRRTVPVDRRQIGDDMLSREREFDKGIIISQQRRHDQKSTRELQSLMPTSYDV